MTVPISAPDLALLRAENHKVQFFGTFLVPDIIWTAQVNASPSRGDTQFDFDGGSGTNFLAIDPDMPVYVGSLPGSRDIGRLRVRSITSGDGGVTGTLTVARNVLSVQDNYYLTFDNDHPLLPKYPLIIGDPDNADFRKDGDITYSNQNEDLAPVVVAGPHRADFLTGASLTFNPHLEDSYTMAPGATLTTFAVSAVPSAGFTDTINSTTGVGTISFTAPGKYWVKYTITDDNGTTQVSYRFYYVHSTDPTNTHYPHVDFTCGSISGDWNRGGWSANLTFTDEAALNDIFDEQLAIIWAKAAYGTTAKQISLLADEPTTLICGYLRQSELTRQLDSDVHRVNWTIETIEAVMNTHYMFSVSLEAKNTSPTAWYEFRNELTNPRAIHHLWKWHSTLFETTDVLDLNINTDLRAYAEMEDGTLYSMADDMLLNKGIRWHVVSDQAGRLHITPDINLLDDTDRAALTTVVQAIDGLDESTDVVINRNPVNRVVMARVSGFYWDGAFETSETEECPNPPCPDPDPYCGLAPTSQPDDEGPSIINLDQQTLKSADHAKALVGQLFARENNVYPDVKVNWHGNYSQVLDVAYPYLWTMNLAVDDTLRGIIWTDQELICRSVSLQPNHVAGIIQCTANFEAVVDGIDGVLTDCLDELPDDPGDEDTDGVPPLGEVVVTGSSVYQYCGNNNWLLRTGEDVFDLTKDYRWSIRQSSIAPCSDAILWYVGGGYIKRSVDAGQNWTDVTPLTNPPNDSGDAPAPTVGDLDYVVVESNPFYNGEFAVLARYQNGGGSWRSWLLYTNDDGGTWTWQSIDASGGGTYSLLDTEDYSGYTSGQWLRNTMADVGNDNIAIMTVDDGGVRVTSLDVSGNTITQLDTDEGGIQNALFNGDVAQIAELSTTNNRAIGFFVATTSPLPGATNYVYARIINVGAGGSISFTGSPVQLVTCASGSEIAVVRDSTVGIGEEGAFLLLYLEPTTNILKGVKLSSDGIAITKFTEHTFTGITNPAELQVTEYNVDNYIATYADTADSDKPKAVPFEMNGPTFNQGTTATISTTPMLKIGFRNRHGVSRLAAYSDGADYVFFSYILDDTNQDLYVVALEGDSFFNTVTVGTPTLISDYDDSFDSSLIRTANNTVSLFYLDIEDIGGGRCNLRYNVRTFTGSGLTLTDLADTLVIEQQNNIPIPSLFDPLALNANYLVGLNQLYLQNTVKGWLIGLPAGANSCKVLDGSIAKGSGSSIYITKWLNDELFVDNWLLASLSQLQTKSLGGATESQLNNFTYTAAVWAPWGNDDNAYVYGRMADVNGGLGHIGFTNDGGVNVGLIIGSYGAAWVGALVTDYIGALYYILATATGSTAYHNLTQKAVLPYGQPTNPHALTISAGGVLYACAGGAGSIMVARSTDKGQTWADFTFNHQAVEAVWAVETL